MVSDNDVESVYNVEKWESETVGGIRTNSTVKLLFVEENENCETIVGKRKAKSTENLSSIASEIDDANDAFLNVRKKRLLSCSLSYGGETVHTKLEKRTSSIKKEDKSIIASRNENCTTESLKGSKKGKSVNCQPSDIHKESGISIKVVQEHFPIDSLEHQEGCMRFLGMFLALIAALQFSLSALIIKVLGYHPFNLGTWRFAVMVIIPIPILINSLVWSKQSFMETVLPGCSFKTVSLILLQAVLGANSILLTFFGFKYLNIADCIVIGTSAPVFVTLFAFICLGERCGVFPMVTALLALTGVTIISKPPILTGEESLSDETVVGVTTSFSSMILLTICYIVIRYLRKVHHALLNLCFALAGFFESLVIAYLMDKLEVPKSFKEVGLIIISAVLAFSAQTCVTLALKFEQAGPVALVRTMEVLFAFGWQAIFLGVKPDLFSVLGAIVTLSGVVLTSFRKMIMSLPVDDENRKRFRFLLI